MKEVSSVARSYIIEACAYKTENMSRYEDVSSIFSSEGAFASFNKDAVAHDQTPYFSPRTGAGEFTIAKEDVVKAVARQNETSKIASLNSIHEHIIKSIGGDARAGEAAQEIVGDVDRTDSWRVKKIKESTYAYRYNLAVTFFLEAHMRNRFFGKSKTITYNHLLLDKQSSPDDIQTGRYIGFDGVIKNYEELAEEYRNETNPYLRSEYKRMLSDLALRNSTFNEEKEEIYQKQLNDETVEFAYFDVYYKGHVYNFLISKEGGYVLKVSSKSVISADGREIRFNAHGGAINTDDGFYSISPFQEHLPFIRTEAEMLVSLVSAIKQNADNTLISEPNIYQDLILGLANGKKVISTPTSALVQGRDAVTEIPKPNLGGLEFAFNFVKRYSKDLNPTLSDEALGQANTRLTQVHNDNIQAIKKLIEVQSPRFQASRRDRVYIILKLLRDYGPSNIYIRSISTPGLSFRKVLKSKIFGETDNSISKLSLDFDENSPENMNKRLLQTRELIAQMRSSSTFNPKNIDNFIMKTYKDIINADDIFVLRCDYSEEVARTVLRDFKSIVLGQKIKPTRMVTEGYAKTLVKLIEMNLYDLMDDKGKFTTEGDRVIKYLKEVATLYARNKITNSPSFRTAESQDQIDATMSKDRATTPQQPEDPSKSSFAVQTPDYTQGGDI